jgi:hypothetical protein
MPREEKNSTGVCVVGNEETRDEILVARRHAGAALAAATLRAIGRERHALDVARMRDGDDHVLALDQVLVVHRPRLPSTISVRRGVANSSRIATARP